MTPGLIERLEGAGAGSRELDRDVWQATGGWDGVDAPPSFTTSLDAALALADLVYPDGWLDLTISNRTARASQCFEGNRAYHGPRHASPAIAVCIAILKARATQEQG